MPPPSRPGQPNPGRRVDRNTSRILDAALVLLSNEGWSDLTFAHVGRECGLSPFTIRSRASTPSELAALLWRERLAPVAMDLVQAPMGALASNDKVGFVRGCRTALTRTPELDAVAELLVMAHFDSVVAEAIDEALVTTVRRWCTAHASVELVGAVRSAYTLSLTLGLLLMSRFPWARDPGIDVALRLRYAAMHSETTVAPLPPADASHFDVHPVLAADDEALDRMLNMMLDSIARRGFDATRVKDVCEAAGYTEGLAFRRYRTKVDLLVEATRRQEANGWQANADFMQDIESRHGLATAEAIYLREVLEPGRVDARVRTLEQARLAWHNVKLLSTSIQVLTEFRASLLTKPGWGQIETEADFFLNTAAPLGALLLPRLLPSASSLPWNAVTVPLFDALETRAGRAPH